MLSTGVGLLVFLGVFLPTGQATPTAAEPAIPPIAWELVAWTGADGDQTSIDDPSRYTVQFLPDGQLMAKFDCNQGGGSYIASDGRLALTDMRSTLMLCEPDSQGANFQVILQSATSYAFDPDGFLLLHGDKGTLRLQPELSGVRWEWQEFQGSDDTIVRPDDPGHYTVEFLPERKLAIQADCNRAVGVYSADSPKLDLRVGGVTRVMCPSGSLMDRFLRDLDQVSSYVFRDGKLYLALPVDAGILEFTASYVAPPAGTPAAG